MISAESIFSVLSAALVRPSECRDADSTHSQTRSRTEGHFADSLKLMNVLTEYLQLGATDEGCSQATQSRVYGPQITSYITEWTNVANPYPQRFFSHLHFKKPNLILNKSWCHNINEMFHTYVLYVYVPN